MSDCHDVNATVSAFSGIGAKPKWFPRRRRNDGQRGVSTPFGTRDLPSVWQSMGVSPAQHPFPSRVFGRRNLNREFLD
jgi:hypothetical protein